LTNFQKDAIIKAQDKKRGKSHERPADKMSADAPTKKESKIKKKYLTIKSLYAIISIVKGG
jgi:hypothetical protein